MSKNLKSERVSFGTFYWVYDVPNTGFQLNLSVPIESLIDFNVSFKRTKGKNRHFFYASGNMSLPSVAQEAALLNILSIRESFNIYGKPIPIVESYRKHFDRRRIIIPTKKVPTTMLDDKVDQMWKEYKRSARSHCKNMVSDYVTEMSEMLGNARSAYQNTIENANEKPRAYSKNTFICEPNK